MRTVAYLPDGTVRALWDDDVDPGRAEPRRASRVEAITEGKHRGKFCVDFSLLGEAYAFCLATTFRTYKEAVAAEQTWLVCHWVKGDPWP